MNENFDDVSARLRRSLNTPSPELSADIVGGAATRTAPHVVNRGRRLQLAAATTVAVAAVAVGALVIAPTLQRGPLFTAAGTATPSAMGAAEDSTMDMRIANWVNYEYVAGEGLSTKGGDGHVYQLKRAGSAEQVLLDAAGAFGVDGDAHKSSYFDPAYPTYVVGSEDGTAPSVTVTWTGTGDWWYSNPAAYPPLVCTPASEEEKLVGGDAVAGEVCAAPEVTENLAPSESEARSQAAALFAETGFEVDAGDIRVTADEWATTAAASLTVDGVQTAIEWSISWAPSGEISWASGHSIDVVDKGSYGTVSEKDAIGRLPDWRWYGQPGPEFQGGMMHTFDTGVARSAEADPAAEEPTAPTTDPAPTEEPGAGEPGTAEPGTVEPTEPTEPEPGTVEPSEPDPEPTILPEPLPTPEEPKTVVVTVEEASSTLLLMWDSAGNAWLVPGLATQNPEGWWVSVVSLVEGVIELPAPIEIEPFTVDGRLD
jgi:hypothetical protein